MRGKPIEINMFSVGPSSLPLYFCFKGSLLLVLITSSKQSALQVHL